MIFGVEKLKRGRYHKEATSQINWIDGLANQMVQMVVSITYSQGYENLIIAHFNGLDGVSSIRSG